MCSYMTFGCSGSSRSYSPCWRRGSCCSQVVEHLPAEQNFWARWFKSRPMLVFFFFGFTPTLRQVNALDQHTFDLQNSDFRDCYYVPRGHGIPIRRRNQFNFNTSLQWRMSRHYQNKSVIQNVSHKRTSCTKSWALVAGVHKLWRSEDQ